MRRTCSLFLVLLLPALVYGQALPGTQLLTAKDDLARQMVTGIDRYLTRLTKDTAAKRRAAWKPDRASPEAYDKWQQPRRERLKKILGVVEERLPVTALDYVGDTAQGALVAETDRYKIYSVRWPVLPGVFGEGLWFKPEGEVAANIVVVPDADQYPESSSWPQFLAENGCQVLVLTLVDRRDAWSGSPRLGRSTNQPHREFVYRMAYEMGRHVIGYEIQKVLAAIDWFARSQGQPPCGVVGYGEGGLLALYAAAIDPRIDAVAVSGYFGPRENLHDEPIYRNVWSLLRDFGDAEIASLIAPRGLYVESATYPRIDGPRGKGGAAPGRIAAPDGDDIEREFAAAASYWSDLESWPRYRKPVHRRDEDFRWFVWMLLGDNHAFREGARDARVRRARFDPQPRQKRQFDQLVAYTQGLLTPAAPSRKKLVWDRLVTTSPEELGKSQVALRERFWQENIGKLAAPTLPMNPRTRLIYDEPRWKGYEVVLDLHEDVICYGILLVPNDIKSGERRPVVVCQHGLEGRPTDIVDPKTRTKYYNSFGAQLADRGFIVFAPQNPYIFGNEFRQVVRKANPLGLTLYSFIVGQHERILEWLATLPYVDASRIAYYGLSYGGKVAMRIPALLGGYCLSICSGDFNEWIWKNINLDWVGSYMWSGEYEMYEFDLGNTFNYAEMAALIAPRPFMVERGHSDGVGLDEYVAFEFAKVRRFYAQLGLAGRTEIEFFVGGHVINGQGTFAFLHKHLNFPARTGTTSR